MLRDGFRLIPTVHRYENRFRLNQEPACNVVESSPGTHKLKDELDFAHGFQEPIG